VFGCSDDVTNPEASRSEDLLTELDEGCASDQDEDGHPEAKPEIELESDPFRHEIFRKPDREWEDMIRALKPREFQCPSPDEQRARIRHMLSIVDNETGEPSEERVAEARDWLENIRTLIPNHEEFAAASFSRFYPAWHELLKGTGRKSARTVLGWIKNGFKPRFVGTTDAKPAKRKVVVAMLRKLVPADRILELLSGRFPHAVEFANHQSFYRKWEFSSEQIVKLIESGAGGIWKGPEPPVVISPMGVVEYAGKDSMVINERYVNLFLEALPFRYMSGFVMCSLSPSKGVIWSLGISSPVTSMCQSTRHFESISALKWDQSFSTLRCFASGLLRRVMCLRK
jgi:hypothetical protein